MGSYLERFEWVAEWWAGKKRTDHTNSVNTGEVKLEAYTRLSTTDRKDYSKVKDTVLKRFNLT